MIRSPEKTVAAVRIHHPALDLSRMPLWCKAREKFEAGCPRHGFWWATLCNLVRGHGCPKCRDEKLKGWATDPSKDSHFYFAVGRKYVKFGMTRNPDLRLQALRRACDDDFRYEIIEKMPEPAAYKREQEVLESLKSIRYRHQYRGEGWTEVFDRVLFEEVSKDLTCLHPHVVPSTKR